MRKKVCWKQWYRGEKGRVNLEKLWLSRKDDVITPDVCNYKVETSSTAVGCVRGTCKKVNQKNSFNPTALGGAWETYKISFCPSQNSESRIPGRQIMVTSLSLSLLRQPEASEIEAAHLCLFRFQGQFYEAEILLIHEGTAFYGRIYYMTTIMLHTWF